MSEYVVDVSVESPVIRYVTLVVWFVLLLMCHDLWIDGVMITLYKTFSDSSVRVTYDKGHELHIVYDMEQWV